MELVTLENGDQIFFDYFYKIPHLIWISFAKKWEILMLKVFLQLICITMRFKHVDCLRGIAAIMVTLFHLTNNSSLSKTTANYGSYGWVGVEIFFVISGFVLPYSLHYSKYKLKMFGIFMVKRMVRIYPAYIITMIIGILMALITGRDLLPLKDVLSHLVFLNSILGYKNISPVFWTLAIEFQFYLLIGLIYPCFSKSNSISVIFIILLTLVSLFLNQLSFIIYWIPFFSLGILIYNKHLTGLNAIVFWILSALIIVFINYVHGTPQAVAATFAVLFIVFAKYEKPNPITSSFYWLGTISYSLYLVHWELGRAAVNISRHLPVVGNMELIKVFIGIAFSIFMAWLMYNLIEKPSIKSSKQISYKS